MLLVAVMGVALAAVSVNAGVIVSENFGGDGSGELNGTAADTFLPAITAAGGSATWGAGTGILDNGVFNTIDQRAAYLNMGSYINKAKGTAKGLFKLTMTISPTTVAWISLGFGVDNNPITTGNFTYAGTNGLATIVYRAQTPPATQGELDMWGGPSSGNAVDGPQPNTGNRTVTVTLDLTPANYNGTTIFGKATWSDSVLGVLGSYTYIVARNFNSILITEANGSKGTVSNLTFSQEGQAGPSYWPDPKNNQKDVTVDLSGRIIPNVVSWLSPDYPDDPEIVSVFGYNVYMDPNQTKVANATPASTNLQYKSVGQIGTSFDPPTDLNYYTTYYWRVDSVVDLASVPGTDPNTITGAIWSFRTVSDDQPPTVVIDTPDTMTWVNKAVQLNATITDNGHQHSPITIAWTSSEPNTVFTPSAAAEDPVVTMTPGTFPKTCTLTCSVKDTYNPSITNTDTMVVRVYADPCVAALVGRAAQYPMDLSHDCVIDLSDLAIAVDDWLVDYKLTAPTIMP
jgi:hypothetical protein